MNSRAAALIYIATGAILTLSVGAIVYATTRYLSALKPDHLSFTYSQPITQQPAIFHVNDIVPVEALFYNSSDQNITFTAFVFWSMVEDGHQILQLNFERTLAPGCTELHFENSAPQDVQKITKQHFDAGATEVKWRIEGHNSVTDPYAGGLQPFQVEEATFIPDDSPLPEAQIEDRLSC